MPRLIVIDPAVESLPSRLRLVEGDLVHFAASGGRVRGGSGAVELLGVFVSGVLDTAGHALVPAGAPDAVVFRARRPGTATVEVLVGDPWEAMWRRALDITVAPIGTDDDG